MCVSLAAGSSIVLISSFLLLFVAAEGNMKLFSEAFYLKTSTYLLHLETKSDQCEERTKTKSPAGPL